jgi:hypothetical protein
VICGWRHEANTTDDQHTEGFLSLYSPQGTPMQVDRIKSDDPTLIWKCNGHGSYSVGYPGILNVELQFISLTGQVLESRMVWTNQSFSLNGYAKGLYLVHICSEKEQLVTKVYIE